MDNLFKRTFYTIEKENIKEPTSPLNSENAAMFAAHTQEEIHMLQEVENEMNRAKNVEDHIFSIITYKTVPVQFGESWSTDKWPDSITIYLNGNELITLAIPPLSQTYDKEDVLDYGFLMNGYPLYIHFDNSNGTKQMRPTKLHVPEFFKGDFSIGISTKTLPWCENLQLINDYASRITSIENRLSELEKRI